MVLVQFEYLARGASMIKIIPMNQGGRAASGGMRIEPDMFVLEANEVYDPPDTIKVVKESAVYEEHTPDEFALMMKRRGLRWSKGDRWTVIRDEEGTSFVAVSSSLSEADGGLSLVALILGTSASMVLIYSIMLLVS